jgi:DNA-binding transcriptional regulator YiaG
MFFALAGSAAMPRLSRQEMRVAQLESAIRETIARGARRQVRAVVMPLRRELLRLRKRMTEIQATVVMLRKSANGWKRLMDVAPVIPHVSEEDAKAARLSPRLVVALRKRLGLSQSALARLVGVSAPAVAHWEAGNSEPTGQHRANLVALRRVGKREARDLLARRAEETPGQRPRARRREGKRRRTSRR